MTDEERRDIEQFRASARVYRKEKEIRSGGSDAKEYQTLIREDVKFVETVFRIIEKQHGPGAKLLVWTLYTEGKTQAETAAQFGLSRRQLQYSVNKWLREACAEYRRKTNQKESS